MTKKTVLVIGGTSGLGFELAKLLSLTNSVIITGTGRKNTQVDLAEFRKLELSKKEGASLGSTLDEFVAALPEIDKVVYAAGQPTEAPMGEHTDHMIELALHLGVAAPAMFLSRLCKKQQKIGTLVAITSTAQFTPRPKEPLYTASKAGLAMMVKSLSFDSNFDKVLVAAPAGMNTDFWRNTDKDASSFLDPVWVATKIIDQLNDHFCYREMRILRNPARVEVVETR